ncbi:hypothetical protein N7476_004833 [Penicillium atrosanguineum]|uniref:DUF6919 domain-containing protein n=1 Tax=Penicillium atrosanguineum TaxID=1132637 RepID=A0A9W9PY81_9EURO|nr:hypothetical protein N7526_001779 [Penicillium atrosanguineum]KAJ5144365.1 hypothetical protein N7526_001873 [Penicillium atrosanguineum]KAJ5318272.1 hypothetical protein N7476_004692 [Penicillium atrosanguineum]KAJ5318413.1 hypothetical protein N7476_004833 [Penicillium atrosanguineum]
MAELPQDAQQWNQSTGFTALLELNKKFLRGEISSSPYHYGPIEEETRSLVPSLLKLHERRILTWSSQPYLRERKRGDERKFYDHWQRPFISFVVAEKDNPRKLFQELEKKRDIKVHARKAYSPEAAVQGSFTKKKIVTKYRRSFFWRRWKVFTTVDPAANLVEEDIFCLEAMKQAKPWEFEVVAASWKDVDITGIVIEAVDAARA